VGDRKGERVGDRKGERVGDRKGELSYPSPSPSPDPGPNPEEDGLAGARPRAAGAARPDAADAVRAVFAHYRTYHPRAFPKPIPTSKEWRAIRARLREGFSAEDLCAAIDGNHRSPFHCGENDGNKRYHALGLIIRDGSHVTQFMEVGGEGPVLSEKERRSKRAAQSWLERMDECEQASASNSPPL